MKKVSIIIPVIREKSVKTCISAIEKNAGIPIDQYEILTEIDSQRVGCPKMVKKLTKKAKYDLVMFLGDDTEPQEGFLVEALKEMEKLPDFWGVIGLNTEPGNPIAHWLAHKKMLNLIPGRSFFSTEYLHCWCDNELRDIAEEFDRWGFAEKAKIKHHHPINSSAGWDKDYERVYSEKAKRVDHMTYLLRKKDRNKTRHGTKLAIAVPLTTNMLYPQFFFSFVKLITEYMVALASSGKSINIEFLIPDFPGQIDAVRNNLVVNALYKGCTHILMLDTDQIYKSDNIVQTLLDHNKPVIGAKVHRRYFPYDPLLLKGKINNFEMIPDDEIKPDGFNTSLKVDATGAGCILYNTDIFIKMIDDDYFGKWFELKTGLNGQPIGEDIGFCDRLKGYGVDIYVDCSIDIGHITLFSADWGSWQLAQKILKVSKGGEKNGA